MGFCLVCRGTVVTREFLEVAYLQKWKLGVGNSRIPPYRPCVCVWKDEEPEATMMVARRCVNVHFLHHEMIRHYLYPSSLLLPYSLYAGLSVCRAPVTHHADEGPGKWDHTNTEARDWQVSNMGELGAQHWRWGPFGLLELAALLVDSWSSRCFSFISWLSLHLALTTDLDVDIPIHSLQGYRNSEASEVRRTAVSDSDFL